MPCCLSSCATLCYPFTADVNLLSTLSHFIKPTERYSELPHSILLPPKTIQEQLSPPKSFFKQQTCHKHLIKVDCSTPSLPFLSEGITQSQSIIQAPLVHFSEILLKMSGLRPPTPPGLEHGRVKVFCACRRINGSWQGSEFDCAYACDNILDTLKNKWNPYLIGLNQHWRDAKQEMRSRGTPGAASREVAARRFCVDQYEQYQVYVEQVTNAYKDHTGQNYPVPNSQWPDQNTFDQRVFN